MENQEVKPAMVANGDLSEAVQKMVKAVDAYVLGEGYREKGDYVNALKYYKMAAEVNHCESLNAIGVIYMNGLIGNRDYSLAIEYFKKAIEYGSKEAILNIGKCYLYGTEEYEKAVEAFKSAMEIESVAAEAYNKIGVMYFWGNNYKPALEYFKKAYELGHEDTYDLGLMHLYNYDNLTNDVEEGIRLLDENAMKRNDKDSSIELALYFKENNDKRASKYIEKCKSMGILDIEDRIEKVLNGEDVDLYK